MIAAVICIHGREHITKFTISYLQQQLYKNFQIVLVGDSETDRRVALELKCHYLRHANEPLGLKWQAGIDYARIALKPKPEAFLIVGSDDLLTRDWCQVGIEYIKKGYALVGTNTRYVMRLEPKHEIVLLKKRYPTERMLGAGRLISSEIVNRLDGQLFTDKNSGLDADVAKCIKNAGGKLKFIDDEKCRILMLKGNWNMKHPWGEHFKVKKIQHWKAWLDILFPDIADDILNFYETK